MDIDEDSDMNPIENSTGLELLEQVMAGVKELPEIEPRPDFTRQVMFNIKEKEKLGRFVFPSLILTPFQLIFSPFQKLGLQGILQGIYFTRNREKK
ncbi:MAG TPA: hypothetical protein VK469_03745 [Candidatus Kapabacteria bacterium]|nr:hypothetical protein [Candidatus Kapabacteria bacterium]